MYAAVLPIAPSLPSYLAKLSAAVAALAVLVPSGAALRVGALSGQHAPGTAAGTTFTFFGSAAFDGAPTIGADSSSAFAAILSDGTDGFWVDRGAGPELLARSGMPAPGTPPGVVFSQRLSEIVLVEPPLLVPGHAVLHDTVSGPGVDLGNDEGIWHGDGSGLSLVMREGAAAPGLGNVQLGQLGLRALDDVGRAIVTSSLSGAVVAGNDEAIWRAAPGSLELLAREGDGAPGAGLGVVFATAGSELSAFPFLLANAEGDLVFAAGVHGPGTSASNDEALFVRDIAGTRLLLREGDAVPGMPGFVFSGGSSSFHSFRISFANDGHVAIAASVASATASSTVLLSDSGGVLAPVVRAGDSAPGTNGNFVLFGRPWLNGRGDVALLASTTLGPGTPPLGLWIAGAGGVRALALPGQQLAGQPVATVFRSVRLINGFNDAGCVLFTAELSPAGGGFGSTALLLADPLGVITVLARTGEQLAVAVGDLRTVEEVEVRVGALSGESQAAFAVRFTDGSGAELVAGLQVEHVGAGTAGKGGLVPALNVTPPGIGASGAIEVTHATGGAFGVLGVAFPDPLHPELFATFALGCGHALLATNLVLVASPLSGTPGAIGEGAFLLPLGPVGPGSIGTTFYSQAAYVDSGAPCGVFSLTDLLRARIR